jgi:DNA-binding Lrp family transcriptional regulator
MPRTQSADFLERVIPEIRTGGARNIVELAKALHLPVETTRYKVKGMLKRGLSVHASVDYNKFDLVNHEAYFTLSPKAQANERRFFQALAEEAYLTSYAKRLPDSGCVCSFAIPAGESLSRMMRGLVEEGLLESTRVEPLSQKRDHMIQASFFHLKRGSWKIDWSKVKRESPLKENDSKKASASSSTSYFTSQKNSDVSFDDLDLMIARALEQNALIKLSDIASSLKTTLNNVFYHFHKHILEGSLIEEFVIRWNGSPKEESVFVQFEFDRLGISEEKTASSSLRRLPFLWSEAQSFDSGLYIGEAMIPTAQYMQTLQYLSETLGESSEKLKVTFLDPRTRHQFPLPAHLFKEGKWKFDPDDCAEHIVSKLKR